MYLDIFDELEKITLYKKRQNAKNNRLEFPEHRGCVFGYVRERYSGKVNLSLYSRKYPHIYEMMKQIGEQICKHPFTSIQVNRNLVCPKHKDKKNIGPSTIVSFGNYTGCKLVIEDQICDAYETPIEFNGFEKEHYNTDDLQGIKYSLIFYNITQ